MLISGSMRKSFPLRNNFWHSILRLGIFRRQYSFNHYSEEKKTDFSILFLAYKCTVNRNDKKEILCYKQYKIQHNDASAIAKVLEQLMPLMHVDHENLIKYHGIALEHDHILFFMEYCSHGTIAQLLLGTSLSFSSSHLDAPRSSVSLVCSINDTSSIDSGIIQTPAGFVFFQEFLVQRYTRQLLSALSCLHSKEIIHRDIRNVNIFLTDSTKQSIKLGDVNFIYDFKFMKKQSSLIDMESLVKIRESIVFYAPETITQNETTTKSDIWSLGCAIIHMLTGRIPWSNPTIASSVYYLKILRLVADGGQPPIPTDLSLSKECIDFLGQCFQHDPNKRPSSHVLLEHPFVKE
jgi:serine/threonine protein kinase